MISNISAPFNMQIINSLHPECWSLEVENLGDLRNYIINFNKESFKHLSLSGADQRIYIVAVMR